MTMDNDITFDWSDKLYAGTNHWQPAYEYQQPLQLQEAFLQHHERSLELNGGMYYFILSVC